MYMEQERVVDGISVEKRKEDVYCFSNRRKSVEKKLLISMLNREAKSMKVN